MARNLTIEDRQKNELAPGLYIVATPIGNLDDITLRSISTLRNSTLIACEDKRVTGKLLRHLGIQKPLLRYDDHAGEETRERLVAEAACGPVALVSDAGTPLISDPGYRLVQAMHEAGIDVIPVPGPCAAIAALTASGLPSDAFFFAGFVPTKEQARRNMFTPLATIAATLIFYDTGPRLVKTLTLLADIWPERKIAVGRELTKLHEECRRGSADELAEHYAQHPPKGEIVLMVGPPIDAAHAHDSAEIDALLLEALARLKPSKAAAEVAKTTGEERSVLYQRALELRDDASEGGK